MSSALRLSFLSTLGMVIGLTSLRLDAANYYWDVNGTTVAGDGSGSWRGGTGNALWSTNESGTTVTGTWSALVGTGSATVQFGFGEAPSNTTTGGTVSIGNSTNTSNMVTCGAIIFNASGTTGYYFQNNVANSNLSTITLNATGTNGISAGTGMLLNANITGDITFGKYGGGTGGSGTNSGNVGTAAIVLARAQTWTNNSTTYALNVLGPVSGAFDLTTNGPGTIQFGGTNTFGNLTVNAGTVKLTNGSASGPGALTVSGGATLNLLAPLAKNIAGSGAIIVGPGGALTASSLGTGSLLVAGDLSSAASFTDTLSGTMGLASFGMGGNATVGMAVSSRILSSGTVALSGTGNLLSLTGIAAPGNTYTLVQGAGFANTGDIAVTGPAVGNQTILLGGSATIGRTTYSFTSTPSALQLVTTGSQATLTWTGVVDSTWDYTTNNWTMGSTSTFFAAGDNGTIGSAAAITVQAGGVVGDAINVTNSTGTVSLAGGSLTATALAKSNAGALSLGNAVTAGALTISRGAVTIDGAGSLAATTIANNGTLSYTTTGSQTLAAAMSGTGSLGVSGGGTLSLTGSSSFDGPVSIGAGSTLRSSGTLGGGTLTASVANDGTLVLAADGQNIAGRISGAGAFVKATAGTVATLSGSNSYSGDTIIQAGTLVIANGSALGSSAAGTIVASGGSLDIAGQTVVGESLSLTGSGNGNSGALKNSAAATPASWIGPVSLTSAQTSVGGDGDITLLGGVSGGGGLYKIGENTLTLAAPSSFTGPLFISTGVLQAVDPTALPNTALSWNNSNSSAELDLVAAGDYAMSSIGQFGSYLRVGSSGTGNVALTINGDSSLAGTANKSLEVYERTTVVLGGSLTAGAAPARNRDVQFYNAGDVVINGIINGGATGTIGQFGIVQSANAPGQGGTLTLNGANSFTGMARVSAGTIKVGNAMAFGSTNAGVTISAATITDTSGIVTTVGQGTVDLNGFTIADETLTMDGTVDRVSLVNSNATTPATWTGAVSSSGTAAFGGAGSLVMSGAISGFGLLVKTGAETVTLTGSNPFNGSVSIEQGTLAVGPGGTLAVPALTGGALSLAGASGQIATFTDTAAGGTMALGSFTMGGDATLGLTVGIGTGDSLAASGPVSVTGGNNLITLSGIAAIGNSYTLVSGSSLVTTGATVSVGGPAVGNNTIALGQSVTSGRATYSFAKTATSLQLTVTGSLLNLTWTGSQSSSWDYTSTNWQSGGTGYAFGPGDSATIASAASITVEAGGVAANAVAVTNASGSVELSGGTLTAASLTKSGAGTFTTNANLTTTSGITVSGGSFQIGPSGALGGGTFASPIVNNAAFVSSGTANQTLSGVLSGTGTLTQSGSGTLFLTGTSTSTGRIAVAAGSSLKLSNAGVLGSGTFVGEIANDGSFVASSSVSQTFAGTISGSGAFTKSGSTSSLMLAGNNTYTGTTTVGSGTLQLGSATSLGSTAAGTAVTAGGVLDLSGQTGVAEPLSLASSGIGNSGALINSNTSAAASVTGDVTLNDSATGFGGVGDTTLAGLVTGSGGLTKWGEGTVTLAGTANYTGGLTMIQAGTLRLQSPAVRTSGTLQSSNSASSSTLDLADSGSYALDFLSLGQILRVNHSGTGSATLTFAGGALTGNVNKVLETGVNTTVVISGTFTMPSGTATTRSVVVGGAGTTVFNGPINDASSLVPSNRFGLIVGGSSTTPVGTTILNAANTYNGDTVVVAGTLKLGNSLALGSTAAGTVVTSSTLAALAGGVLDINGQTVAGESLTLDGAAGSVSLVNSNATVAATWNGPVSANGSATIGGAGSTTLSGNLGGSGSLTKADAGRLTLAQANDFAGTVSVTGGTLELSNAASLASGTLAVTAGGTVQVPAYLKTSVAGLDLSGNGLVNVNSGSMGVAGGLSATALVAEILEGRGNGSWTGTSGITSSAVAANVALGVPRAIGWLDKGNGSVSFAFAAPGDTNLDWQVDVLDAANLITAGKFNTGGAATWAQGDFNYDGIVNVLDAANFLSTGLYDTGAYNPPPGIVGAVAAVPEPSTWTLLAGGLALVAARAAKRRRTCMSTCPVRGWGRISRVGHGLSQGFDWGESHQSFAVGGANRSAHAGAIRPTFRQPTAGRNYSSKPVGIPNRRSSPFPGRLWSGLRVRSLFRTNSQFLRNVPARDLLAVLLLEFVGGYGLRDLR